MTLLDNALEEFRTNIVAPENGRKYGEELLPEYRDKRDDNHALVNLRLDWELSDAAMEDADDQRILDLMVAQMQNDIADLLENGDRDKGADSLLKAMDGSVKRGKELADVKIVSGHVYKEKLKAKKSTEYTVYISLYTEWN